MIELLQKLFLGHVHKWEIQERHNLMDGDNAIMPSGVLILQKCVHCGKLQNFKIKG